jgi:hypothetical protein
MFDKLKAAAGVAGMLKDLPRMQARLEQVKDELGRLQCVGHSKCRHVRAVVNGRIELVSVEIDPSVLARGAEVGPVLQAAIVDAVNDAIHHARREAGQRLADAARELGIPVPAQLLQQL